MSAAPTTPDDEAQQSNMERSVRSQGESEKAQSTKQDCVKESEATGPQGDGDEKKGNGVEAKEHPAEASGEPNDPIKPKRRRGRPRKSDPTHSVAAEATGATGTPGKPGVELRNGKRSAGPATTDNGGGETAAASKRSKTGAKQRKSEAQMDPCILHKDKRDLGKLVAKKFEGYGVYTGEVTQISIGARPLWRIRLVPVVSVDRVGVRITPQDEPGACSLWTTPDGRNQDLRN